MFGQEHQMAETFGKEFGRGEFYVDPDISFLNHGSYGCVPRTVLAHQTRLKEETEINPDKFYRKDNPQGHLVNLQALCHYIGADVINTVFVENFTTGLNTIIRSLKFSEGDGILVTNFTYFAVKVLARESGLIPVWVNFELPLTKDKILESYKQVLSENVNIKIAIVDHITSPSSILMPVKEITALCKSHGVIVAVDGAHVCGQHPLDVESLKVDFYSGNIHKWMWTPRGCAFLWTASRHLPNIRPCVVSHFHGVGYHMDHCVRGTRDDSPYHCVTEALRFENEVLGGIEKKTEYICGLLKEGVALLMSAWNTTCIAIDENLEAPFMRLVRVPQSAKYPRTSHGAADMETELYETYNVRIMGMLVEGDLYIRISANVYNDISDFHRLKDALLTIMAKPEVTSRDFGYQLPIMHWDLSPLIPFSKSS